MNNLWPIVANVLGVFLVILIGAICRRVGWLNRESDHSLATFDHQCAFAGLLC